MNKIVLIVMLALVIGACSTEKIKHKTLIEENFASKHPEWKISKDTIRQDINFGSAEVAIPAKISWVIAEDADNCSHIAYVRLDQILNEEKIEFSDIYTGFIPCDPETQVEKLYETMLINADITVTKKGLKEVIFKGSIGQINGLGKFESLVQPTNEK